MAQTVNMAASAAIKPAQDYINEGDANQAELEKLGTVIEEAGDLFSRMESNLRNISKARTDRRAVISLRFTNPESNEYQKTLAAQERAAQAAFDSDEDLTFMEKDILKLQEIRDMTESQLVAAKKRHSGLVARQTQIAHILEVRASQLNYATTKNYGTAKTVNINI